MGHNVSQENGSVLGWLLGIGRQFSRSGLTSIIPQSLKQALLQRLSVTEVHGFKLYLPPDERQSHFYLGSYEPEIAELLRSELTPESVFCDIGAHIGYFTMMGATLVKESGTVYAFEPFPDSAAAIRKSIDLNGFPNVRLIEGALSGSAGDFKLYLGPQRGRHSLLPHEKPGSEIAVKCFRLDSILDRSPDFAKIDAEGSELAILEGAGKYLPKKMVIEYNREREQKAKYAYEDFVSALSGFGYRTVKILDRSADDSFNLFCVRS